MRGIFASGSMLSVLFAAQPAQAGIPIIYNPGHVRVERVADLPDDAAFRSLDGPLNLGWAYKDYSLYGMPLGYGDADGFVLYNDKGYYILKPGGMALLTARMGQDYAQTYHFNPLGHLWGWVVVLILSGFAAHSTHRRRARISEVAADSHGHDTALAAIARSAAQRDARPVTRDIASARAPLPTRGFGRKGTTPDR